MKITTIPTDFAHALLSYFYEKPYGEVEQIVGALRYYMSNPPTSENSNGDSGETESAS